MKRKTYLKLDIKRNKKIISLFVFVISFFIIFHTLNSSDLKINNNKLLTYILNEMTYRNKRISIITKEKIKKLYKDPTQLLLTTKSNLIKKEKKIIPVIKEETKEPLIYIYNTHQQEEYASSNFIEETLSPTVMISNYIIESHLENNNYSTYIETSSIKEILNKNKWKYSYSYKASRILLEKRKKEFPTLKYFIDVHRDSLIKDRTTTTISNEKYAKILFIVGLENKNYQENLTFTENINKCLNAKYPGLSKGIYKKQGPGVDGIYNQDFSPYTILVEMGGYENTTSEVMNSSIAFSNCFLEVINKYENKPNN